MNREISLQPFSPSIGRRRGWLAAFATLTALVIAPAIGWAQGSGSDATQVSLQGTLGENRIGMTVVLDGSAGIRGGHYFYGKYLQDIPLTGIEQGGEVTLHEPGATFTLHFVGNGSEGNKPLDFENSIGLAGVWSHAPTSLPVKLEMVGAGPATPPGHWYGLMTDLGDAAFEAKIQGFRRAVLAGERAAAARFVHFPLRVNHGTKPRFIKSPRQLADQWPSIFTPVYLAALQDAMPHDLPVINGRAMLGNGVAWFGSDGAEVVNLSR